MKLRLLLFVSILGLILAANAILYSRTVPLLQPGPDYLSQALEYAQSQGFNIIFQQEGSGPYIQYLPFGLISLWVVFAVQRKLLDKHGLNVLWTNLAWITLTTAALIWDVIIAGASQHFNWYWNAALGVGGEGDDVTHFFSGFAIAALLYNIDFFDIFKLRGKLGRLIEAAAGS